MLNGIILYDLPSKGRCACWSLNPWKARLALNYKSLPYKTAWIEYPDVAPTFKTLSIPANTSAVNPNAEYSIPTARLPNGRYVMDSLAIAQELEKLQPEPSLLLDNGQRDFVKRTQQAVDKIRVGLMPIAANRIVETILNPSSAEHFRETRAKRFGMPVAELAKSERSGEEAWKIAEPGFEETKALLQESSGGPYVMGKVPGFADFVLAGLWVFLERLDQGGDLFGRALKYHDSFQRHYEACQQWSQRDD